MIKVALVGAAHIHTPGFIKRLKERAADVAVAHVWDHDDERAKRRAAELGAPTISSVNKIWTDDSIQAVIICSETDRHKKLVLSGATAKKHMFVEKPLGLGSSDSYAMAAAIEQSGVIFQTGYFMRSNPIQLFIHDQIQQGNFGKVTRVRASNCHSGALKGWFDTEWRWMANPHEAGCGAFGDLGTHGLDQLLWWMGEVESATASIHTVINKYPECDEYGEGMIKFKNGAVATLAAGWVDVANPVQFEVAGTEGHATVVNGQLFYQSEKIPGADGKQPWTQLPPANPGPLDLFIDAVSGNPDLPLVKVREAAAATAVMEAMYKGARMGRWVVPKR